MSFCKARILQPYQMNAFQFFRNWFAEACERAGLARQDDWHLPWSLKVALGKGGFCFPLWKGGKLLVCSGGRPEYFAWPWCYFKEIVPVVWDCWPKWQDDLVRFARRNRVRTIFCTASQTAEMVKSACPWVDAVWLPEGVNVAAYPCGGKLAEREIDVLEVGRFLLATHQAIAHYDFGHQIRHEYPRDGLLFPDQDTYAEGLRRSRICICYPRCDTNPEEAGAIETMTQRYWECMLSGTLIAGRAPAELVRFCGYDPVIPLTPKNVGREIAAILNRIDDYQPLADRNRRFAEQRASWDARMAIIKEHLS